jgi:hypothetical protein
MAKRLTIQEIIKRFKNIHGTTYDYSLVNYQGDSKKVKIICSIHGVFEQQPACHIRQKQGCPQCAKDKNNKKIRERLLGNEEFIKRIEKIFGPEAFDYSKLNYEGAHKDVTLVCKKCGNIETKDPRSFYIGYGCLKCQGNTIGKKLLSTEEFIIRSKKIHGDKYDYSKVIYTGISNKVEIICSKHGSFFQEPNVHINMKCNCPECNVSKGEEQIAIFLNQNNINYIFQYQVRINDSYHYYDFYLPDHNIIIEFNGMQHYKPIKFFGGQEAFDYLQVRDKIKKQYCLENQLKLVIIRYDDNVEEILNKLWKNY